MRARISRWGNSLAVRLPRSVTESVGATEGTEVDIRGAAGRIVLRTVPRAYTLAELLGGVTPRNVHAKTETGRPVGREHW
jgi:antitoxin MazE